LDVSLARPTEETAFVALGSNLGNSEEIIGRALERIQSLSAAPLLRSSLFKTKPVDCPPWSPPFLNAVVGLEPLSGETPQSFLRKLMQLEAELGRQRGEVRNAPRPLDLDLIAFGEQTMDLPELILPHPRAHLRRFVLEPMSEIAPDFVLPRQTKTVRELLGLLPLAE
jgi:2-amino-4-hydroxy-6-hydroxymethyldihydropteridine diphosphokinase